MTSVPSSLLLCPRNDLRMQPNLWEQEVWLQLFVDDLQLISGKKHFHPVHPVCVLYYT